MKNTRQIKKVFTAILVMALMVFNIRVIDAAGYISISVDNVYYTDEPVTIVINFGNNEPTMWDINVSSPQLSLSSLKSAGKQPGMVGTSHSISENVGTLPVGTYSISANTGTSTETGQNVHVDAKTSASFEVKVRPTSSGGDTNSGGGNGNNSGNSSGGSSSEDYTEQAPSLTPEELEELAQAEKEAVAKAEKEKEEAELDAKKKTPLFSEIDVISSSDKLNGESLTKIASEKDIFEYSYTLPKRIDSFKLELKALEGATLTYDKEHTIEEGKESVVVPVKAVLGDITQDFKITIYKNKHIAAKIKVGNVELDAYDDELLDKVMVDSGFEKMALEVGEIKAPIYYKGEMRLMLLVEGENAAWYSLDKDSKPEHKGVLYLDKNNNPLFILEADEETSAHKLYQNAYTEKSMKLNDDLLAVDSKLDFNNKYKSWKYDDKREVVYGFDETGVKDFYVFGDESIKAAVVAFDSVDQTYKRISWGLGGVLFSLLGTGSLFAVSKKKNGKKEEDSISVEETAE